MYLTKKQLAEKLNVSIPTIDRNMKKGMTFYKVGKSVRFQLEESERWLFEKQNEEVKNG